MVRGLILGALAFGAVFAAERQYAALGKDVNRYDAMRAMSGDSTFVSQIVKTLTAMIADFGARTQGETSDFVASLTRDVVRYAMMRDM